MTLCKLENPLNWYKYNVSFSIELMSSYIKGVELQAIESVKRYEDKKEQILLEAVPKENYYREIEQFQGLDDETWDIITIFKEYFPSLQRSSALISLFSFFENELNQLCELYKFNKSFKVGFKDLNGNGVERAINYLEKIVGLEIKKQSALWCEIKNIQKIRNLIVHSHGKLVDIDGHAKKHEKNYVSKSPMLTGENEVVLLEGYLMHVLNIIDEYFQLLNTEVKKEVNA